MFRPISTPVALATITLITLPALPQDAPAFLDDLAQRYRQIDTLHATIRQSQLTLGPSTRSFASTTQTWHYEIAFDRDADRLTIAAPWGELAHTDGGLLVTCHECGNWQTHPHAPLSLESLARAGHEHTDSMLNLPALDLLLADRGHTQSQSRGARARPADDADAHPFDTGIAGCTPHAVTIPFSNDPDYALDEGPELTCPATYWIDNDTGLIRRVTVDRTDATRIWTEQTWGEEYSSFDNIESFTTTYDIDYHSIDTPIEIDAFVVSTQGLEETDSPEFSGAGTDTFSDPDGVRFIHQPVPAFTATTLAGDTIGTEDLKGKVVVIDFWATWCAPCVAAMPHLQSIAERYADKGVVVLGINQDTPDHRAAVDAFLEDKAITFPQILDPDDAIATRFGVSALPTTVIVDAEGIVQAWTVGYHVRADYTAQIDRVLAGETLPMPEPPARPGDTLDTIENLALTITPWPAPVTAWEGATLTTVDGTAFYMPHDMGGLAKLDHATGQLTRVAPQGVDPNRAIIAFAPVAGEHGGWLLATDDSTDYADLAFTRVDRNGTRRWSVPLGIDPAIEPTYDAGIETCDIDHDGEDEFLIAVGVSDSESWEEQVILVILDQNGRTLYTKPIALDGFGATHLIENEGEPPVLYIFGYSQLVRVSLDL